MKDDMQLREFEEQLAQLRFAQPPKWLKARAMVAAQNGYTGVARRKRRYTLIAASAAAALFVGLIGQHIISAFGLLNHTSVQSLHATPSLETAGGVGEPPVRAYFNDLRPGIEKQPQGQTGGERMRRNRQRRPGAPKPQLESTTATQAAA